MGVAFTDLAETCAPVIAIETLAAVVSLESNFQPFNIRINGGLPLGRRPTSKAEAIEAATTLIAEHQAIQLGLGGVGIEELRKLNLTVSNAFDPCLNLKATATLLDGYYRLAIRAGATSIQAERVMLQSFYGRSDPSLGAMVQYDAQVQREAERLSAGLTSLTIGQEPGEQDAASPQASPNAKGEALQQPVAPAPSWDVFNAARRSSALIFQNDQSEHFE